MSNQDDVGVFAQVISEMDGEILLDESQQPLIGGGTHHERIILPIKKSTTGVLAVE